MAANCTYVPPTTYLLLQLLNKEPYKKACRLTKHGELLGKTTTTKTKQAGELTAEKKKKKDRQIKRSRQKDERRDRKGESSDSPEIPDRRPTADISGLPSGNHRTELQILNHKAGSLLGHIIIIIKSNAKSVSRYKTKPQTLHVQDV